MNQNQSNPLPEPPDEFLCPILMVLMEDPVIGQDGKTYERAAIERALKQDPRSPFTREPMRLDSLRPNYAIKTLIERFRGTTVIKIQPLGPEAPLLPKPIPVGRRPYVVVSVQSNHCMVSIFALIVLGCMVVVMAIVMK
jgi:hypothetical protein